jgi:hypothetical protein
MKLIIELSRLAFALFFFLVIGWPLHIMKILLRKHISYRTETGLSSQPNSESEKNLHAGTIPPAQPH